MTVDFDPRDPAFIHDPFPVLHRLTEEAPVHWSPRLGGWVVCRYAQVRECLRDPRLSAQRTRPFFDHLAPAQRAEIAALADNIGLWAVFTDPPQHTRLRGLMNKAFSPRLIDSMRPRVAAIVAELLDAVEGRGEMDLIADFAYPLPATVIADMMGVPRADVPQLKSWSDELGAFVLTARLTPDKYRRANAGIAEMTDYFTRLIAERRRRPGDDVVSRLIAAQEGDDSLSAPELVATCVLLLFAGHETTTHLLGNGLLALIQHPDQLALFRARRREPELAASAVEEMLRWNGPSLAAVRVVAEPFALEGAAFETGQRVFLMVGAANRDPRQFRDPDRFDITRGDRSHLAFGYGLHFCLGAPLARIEGQTAFPALLERLDNFRLTGPAPRWSDNLIVRGVDRILLGFDRAQAA